MKSFRNPTIVLLLLYACFLSVWASSGSHLPERIATHFNGSGEPNGWMSRSQNQRFMLIFGLLFPLFVVALCFATRFVPTSLINIPHRDYWLTPERRPETFNYLFRHSLWFACLAVGFVTGIQYLTVQANLQTPPHLSTSGIFGLAGCFLAGTAIWIVILFRHFKRSGE